MFLSRSENFLRQLSSSSSSYFYGSPGNHLLCNFYGHFDVPTRVVMVSLLDLFMRLWIKQ
ncbi:hypothetical protein [Candidatus Ichthyocystis sparus]|uniref:hypothetical protein n=1 Tax=Candidatus Ichthyocystis sparus TaxID=1561004 RepID=UPI0011462850|nr:hypothetical protein [Candidatus Ichthyocystis sparus]